MFVSVRNIKIQSNTHGCIRSVVYAICIIIMFQPIYGLGSISDRNNLMVNGVHAVNNVETTELPGSTGTMNSRDAPMFAHPSDKSDVLGTGAAVKNLYKSLLGKYHLVPS